MKPLGNTLLDVFLDLCSKRECADKDVVQCAGETWTYGDLHTVTSGVASTIGQRYGPRPTVALVFENHPYVIVLLFAVWKLGGIVVSLDPHAPADLMEAMLRNVAPTYVAIPSPDLLNKKIVQNLGIPIELLEPKDITITVLIQRFLHTSPDIPSEFYSPPHPHDVCLYIYTSSASSASNLKCVPVTHESLVSNGRSQLDWFRRYSSTMVLEHLHVLGWSPFYHIMSICSDLCTSVLLTGGCYIFALVPSTYTTSLSPKVDRKHDIPTLLLDRIIELEPDAFTGVPWILEGIKAAWDLEIDVSKRSRVITTLKKFKYFISAGAATNRETILWAKEYELPVLISIGMTELGGNLFHARVCDALSGWSIEDSCISDAVFTLIDESGDVVETEGELCVTSRRISRGYLKYPSTAFTETKDGLITFRTGDIYTRASDPTRLFWRGRKDDFIQLTSGEYLDPRPIEGRLNSCSCVAHSCVVGNKFLSGAGDFVCAIVELTPGGVKNPFSSKVEVTKVVAAINRDLPPPLRIAWSRVLILDENEHIPYTKKRGVFRKQLQTVFGDQLSRLLTSTEMKPTIPSDPVLISAGTALSRDAVEQIIFHAVSSALRISLDILEANSQLSFAELGMDSSMAMIIANTLNDQLSLTLLPNTCYNYIDLASLTLFVFENMGLTALMGTSDSKAATRRVHHQEAIVVVGQALRLPGDINSPKSLWNALVNKRQDIMTSTPPDRWDHESFKHGPPCHITFEKAGFIDLTSFDNAFFGIPAPEALYISPTIRLALESTFEALENANIPISKVKGTDMGVFVASGLDSGYSELLYLDRGYNAYTRFYGTGVAPSTVCGRLSYLLDIHGPSLTVETACSGGLVALDQAVRHLESGRGESAIVCGVNTHTLPGTFGFLSAQKMTSTKSRCATFTDEADGYAASEGVVSLIIKTQHAALRDGDTIYGVIRATNTMHNGRTQGLVAPSVKAQVALQRSLLQLSSLTPEDIDFIEAHGTGTSLGDLIEIQGINEVFRSSHTPSRPLIIGAGKSCIGHTETTSGLVGVVKALLSFSEGAVPGLAHDCSLVPMQIPQHTTKLVSSEASYRALVVAYGFAGTISGAVLEAPPSNTRPAPTPTTQSSPMLFVVSAKTQFALIAYIEALLDFCRQAPETSFRSICYTTCVGREHYRHRFACVVKDMRHLISKLIERLSYGVQVARVSNPRVVFGFPGQGSQFKGMAKELAEIYSGFRSILTEYSGMASSLTGYPILSLLLGDANCNYSIDQSQIAQICIFVYQCSVCKWLETLGIKACAVIGHSLGEIAAAVSGGAFDYESGLLFVIARATFLVADSSNPGAMAAIAAPETIIINYIDTLAVADRVVIAVFNGGMNHVISGAAAAVDLVYSAAKRDGIRSIKLNIDQGFHSPQIEEALPMLKAWLETKISLLRPLRIPFYSSSLAKRISPHQQLSPDYWIGHAKMPVRFSDTVLEVGHEKSLNIVLDIGPQPIVWTTMKSLDVHDKTLLAITSKQGKDQELALLEAIVGLFENNLSLDLSKIYEEREERFSKTVIPTYPFQRQRHYPNFIPSCVQVSHTSADQSPKVVELVSVNQPLLELLKDHCIEGRQVLPGAAFGDFLARLSPHWGCVKSVRFHQPLVLESIGTRVQVTLESDGRFRVFQNDSYEDKDKLCSGVLSPITEDYPIRAVTSSPPIRTLDQDKVYTSFEDNIHFGPAFRNVTQMWSWLDHIDALITVPPSANSNLDRIRKLDPCFHMFGALPQLEGFPESIRKEGFFLPTSLEGFRFHTDNLPSQFICRYFLPLTITHNFRAVSIALEVLSLSGDLLVSCRRYSVAWLPKGIAIQVPAARTPSIQWLRNTWRREEILPQPSLLGLPPTIAYFGNTINTGLLKPFVHLDSDVIFVELMLQERKYHKVSPDICVRTPPIGNTPMEPSDVNELFGKRISIILDISCYLTPGSETFSAFWKHVLWLMKLTITRKIHISNLIVVSYLSSPTDTKHVAISAPSVDTIVQGILRVYRNEIGLGRDIVWGLDLPKGLPTSVISDIIMGELSMRKTMGSNSSSIVAYRRSGGDNDSLVRLVPSLVPVTRHMPEATLYGVAVITGMGSIGRALAPYLVAAGCNAIVFLGRKPVEDVTVIQALASVRSSSSGMFEYMQSDISDLSSIRRAFNMIDLRFGPIRNIIHTAGVVSDAIISTVTNEAFERVLNPKAIGAWNLHLISEEKGLDLDLFVLLSSISVPLGNIGQAAYVGANSFLDSLASYRQGIGLRGLSLQLGAWESRLIEGLNMSDAIVRPVYHKQGIPLVMKALAISDPVQIIADLDLEKMIKQSVTYRRDSMWRELLPNEGDSHHGYTETKVSFTKAMATEKIIGALRDVLELKPDEVLDLEDSLTSCGMDSISFAQARGKVLKDIGVDIPVLYLSDTFSIRDMISKVCRDAGILDSDTKDEEM